MLRFATLLLGALVLTPLAAALPSVPAPSSVQPPTAPDPSETAQTGAALAVGAAGAVSASTLEDAALDLVEDVGDEAIEEANAQAMAALAMGDAAVDGAQALSPIVLPASTDRSLEAEALRARAFVETRAEEETPFSWSGWSRFFGSFGLRR